MTWAQKFQSWMACSLTVLQTSQIQSTFISTDSAICLATEERRFFVPHFLLDIWRAFIGALAIGSIFVICLEFWGKENFEQVKTKGKVLGLHKWWRRPIKDVWFFFLIIIIFLSKWKRGFVMFSLLTWYHFENLREFTESQVERRENQVYSLVNYH